MRVSRLLLWFIIWLFGSWKVVAHHENQQPEKISVKQDTVLISLASNSIVKELGILDPLGRFYLIATSEYKAPGFNGFPDAGLYQINIKTISGLAYKNGTPIQETIFKLKGAYEIYLSSNLETEQNNSYWKSKYIFFSKGKELTITLQQKLMDEINCKQEKTVDHTLCLGKQAYNRGQFSTAFKYFSALKTTKDTPFELDLYKSAGYLHSGDFQKSKEFLSVAWNKATTLVAQKNGYSLDSYHKLIQQLRISQSSIFYD